MSNYKQTNHTNLLCCAIDRCNTFEHESHIEMFPFESATALTAIFHLLFILKWHCPCGQLVLAFVRLCHPPTNQRVHAVRVYWLLLANAMFAVKLYMQGALLRFADRLRYSWLLRKFGSFGKLTSICQLNWAACEIPKSIYSRCSLFLFKTKSKQN